MITEELNSSCLFQTERDLISIFKAKAKKSRSFFTSLPPNNMWLWSKTASRKTQISWNWATLPKNVFYMKMIRRNMCIFTYKFHLLKK